MAEINLKTLTTGGGASLIDVNFNGNLEGQANAAIPLNVNLTDGVSDITPTSVVLTGNDLDIVVEPSGVLFKTIEPSQYTSYRTGDEGWRVQNNWYDYTPPISPKSVAELDYSIGANYFWKLKNPLVVNGVSSTTRFVDVNGVQVFTATGNANLVVIDKLTGMMYLRSSISGLNWNGYIDGALSHSIVVNGITYNDWYLHSTNEANSLFTQQYAWSPYTDPITSVSILSPNNQMFTSTTLRTLTTWAWYLDLGNENNAANGKTVSTYFGRYITNARNLITAP
jgi:hypothetical protein